MDPVSTTSVVKNVMQENIALGVMVLVVLWLMRNLAAARKEHRADMHAILAQVGSLGERLAALNTELVRKAAYSEKEITRNREAINRDRVRRKLPTLHPTPECGVPILVKRETSSKQIPSILDEKAKP